MDYLDPTSINGLNLYTYCNNDPVNYCDPSGHFPLFIITALIGAAIGVGITAAIDYIPDQKFNLHWGWYVGAGLLGAAIGAGVGMAISYSATGTLTASFTDVKWGYAIKSAENGNYSKILKLSTKNPNSKYTCLGKYVSKNSPLNYINIAEKNGYTYFNMGKYFNIADKLGVAQSINDQFILTQFNLGKEFIFTSTLRTGAYAYELELLEMLGMIIPF